MPALAGSQAQFPPSPTKQLNNFTGDITLLAYCLMPNHFMRSLSYQSFAKDFEPDDIKIITQVALDLF